MIKQVFRTTEQNQQNKTFCNFFSSILARHPWRVCLCIFAPEWFSYINVLIDNQGVERTRTENDVRTKSCGKERHKNNKKREKKNWRIKDKRQRRNLIFNSLYSIFFLTWLLPSFPFGAIVSEARLRQRCCMCVCVSYVKRMSKMGERRR